MSIVHASKIQMAVTFTMLPAGNYEIQSLVLFMFVAFCIKIHWLVFFIDINSMPHYTAILILTACPITQQY